MAAGVINGATRLYAIIGDPIDHVRVPTRFNERFAAAGRNAVCVPVQLPRAGFAAGMAGLKALANLDGFIVTAPHKAAMPRYCDVIEPGAQRVGAVNAVRRLADGRYAGTMLDGLGFVAGLRAQGHEPRGCRVFVMGAGGAAAAIGFALAEAGARAIRFGNRTPAHAAALAARIAEAFPACAVAAGPAAPDDVDIAVNATSLGLLPGDALPFDPAALRPGALVADVLMYPVPTALIAAADRAGFATHAGRHMLEGQLGLMADFLGLDP